MCFIAENKWEFDYHALLRGETSTLFAQDQDETPSSIADLPSHVQDSLRYLDTNVEPLADLSFDNLSIGEIIEEGSSEYIAGFIARKFRETHPELCSDDYARNFWVAHVSHGRLCIPSDSWLEQFKIFEPVFQTIHGYNIDRQEHVVQKLSNELMQRFPSVPEKIVSFYAKTRI